MQTVKLGSLTYLVRYPKEYAEGKRYPVILALHGAGYRGNDTDVLKQNPFFLLTEELEDFPFVLVAPQCHENTWFDLFETLEQLVREIASAPYCDPAHLYMMGASMGAYATWQLAMSLPEYFAAIVPICGGGMYWNAPRLVNVAVWAFHGARDTIVFPEESEKMVRALEKAGADVRFTLYPENEHNAWSDTYSNPAVYTWMLSYENRNHPLLKDTFIGEAFG